MSPLLKKVLGEEVVSHDDGLNTLLGREEEKRELQIANELIASAGDAERVRQLAQELISLHQPA
jgi:hypothetical protein